MLKILSVCLTLFAFSSAQVFSQETPYVEGELIIMLHKGISPDIISSRHNADPLMDNGLKHVEMLSELSNIHLFSFNPAVIADSKILKLITNDKMVRAVQFNHFVQERNLPNDPQLGSQWHHVNGNDKDIDSDLAWDITTGGTTANGDEIVVCVIEPGGSNYNHVDLIDNHWRNTAEIPNNGIDDDGNGYVDDYDGWRPSTNSDNVQTGSHGTSVSGMIGAKGNNGSGGAGVNWNVKIMQVQVSSLTESNVIAAYAYPHAMRNIYNNTSGAQGAFVVATNASWGIDNANPLNYPVWCGYYNDLGEVGILNCGATANNNVNIDVVGDMPTGCSSPYMVSVTATNNNDQRTFSAYGATTIDLGAPGSSVYLPSGSSSYSNTSGTSFASPCVAGAIAMVYSAPCSDLAALALSDPQAAADNVRNYIYDGVDQVAQLATQTVTGGRLNVKNALDLAMEDCGGCNAPYPQAANLNSMVQSNGVMLSWNPIPGSIGCQIQGGLANGSGNQLFQINMPELAQFFVPSIQLPLAGEQYRWRVRCGCSVNPLVVGPWTPYQFFFWPVSGSKSISSDFSQPDLQLFPNPSSGKLAVNYAVAQTSPVTIQIFNMVGQVVHSEVRTLESGMREIRLDLSSLTAGVYLFQIAAPSQASETARLIITR